MNKKRMLQKELRLAGATPGELPELTDLADQISELGELPNTTNTRPWWQRFGLVPISAAATGLLLGTLVLALSQTSLPGTPGYPVKRASEQIAVLVDPNYRATVMMRRSQELKQLVNQSAGQGKVLATLAAYQQEAVAYRSKNYAAFEYCKTNLTEAAAIASPAERSAIDSAL